MRGTHDYGANQVNKRGIVVDRKPEAHQIRVKFDDEDGVVSAWIDVLSPSGGSTQAFMMPDMDDEVWCAMDVKGEAGCLIGARYNAKNNPPFGSNDDIGMVWAGGAVSVNKASGAVTITSNGPVTITASEIILESATLTHNGTNIGQDHEHSGVETGSGNSGPPTG